MLCVRKVCEVPLNEDEGICNFITRPNTSESNISIFIIEMENVSQTRTTYELAAWNSPQQSNCCYILSL